MALNQVAQALDERPEPKVVLSTAMLVGDADLTVSLRRVAGERGLSRPIRHPRVQKSGLALAGHAYGVVPARVQILGETEISYLDSLSGEGRAEAARAFFALGLSCVIVTSNREPPRAFVTSADATDTPLFVSEARSSQTINAIHAVLDDRLAPQTTLHGVLLDVFGIGVLLLGKSGIGKSECALELVLRGHRLVADDIVKCDWRPPGVVFGSAASLLRHHIEARGLGVLNVKALFGVTSVRDRKSIDIAVKLVEWDDKAEYDRLGVEDTYHSILDTPIRELTVPVRPGRDMGSILEIAARNELLRRTGNNAAREFMGRLEQQLMAPGSAPDGSTPERATPVGAAEASPRVSHVPRPSAPHPLIPRPSDVVVDDPAREREARFVAAAPSAPTSPTAPAPPPYPSAPSPAPGTPAASSARVAVGANVPRSSESSAWIPAAKPRDDEEDA